MNEQERLAYTMLKAREEALAFKAKTQLATTEEQVVAFAAVLDAIKVRATVGYFFIDYTPNQHEQSNIGPFTQFLANKGFRVLNSTIPGAMRIEWK